MENGKSESCQKLPDMKTTDLVARLRDILRNWTNVTEDEQSVIREAADEIERLRKDNASLGEENCELRSQLVSARAYVDKAIASFDGDPADSRFQEGFLAALNVIRDEAFTYPDERFEAWRVFV